MEGIRFGDDSTGKIGVLCSGARIDLLHFALGTGLLVLIDCLQGRSVFPSPM